MCVVLCSVMKDKGRSLARARCLVTDRQQNFVNKSQTWHNSYLKGGWQIFNVTESLYIAQNSNRFYFRLIIIFSYSTVIENRIFEFSVRNDKMREKGG